MIASNEYFLQDSTFVRPAPRAAIEFVGEVIGAKGQYSNLRSTLGDLIRDTNISIRYDAVQEYKPETRKHNYFLRSADEDRREKAHVDHICECQFLSHCIMQTECLHPVIKNIQLGTCMSKQMPIVQNMLKPLYKIHNGQHTVASYFNLQLMDGDLNILKGKAVTQFIKRQQSTLPGSRGGAVDFASYFKNSQLVTDGIRDADTLAGEEEKMMKAVEDPYLYYLENTVLGGETNKIKAERSEELIQSMIQAFDQLLGEN